MSTRRMTHEERRTAMLEAAVPLFARKGFHAVKTREIAAAAGVSEALLFKHFPSKEALFDAIREHVHGAEEESPQALRFLALPPSTDKLMLGMYLLLSHLAADVPEEERVMPRMVLQSLLDDGVLARRHLDRFRQVWWPAFVEALAAARGTGEAIAVGTPDLLLVWFFHHLGFALRVLKLPGATVEHGMAPEEVAAHGTRLLLRGMGLKEEVIRARFRPRELMALLR